MKTSASGLLNRSAPTLGLVFFLAAVGLPLTLGMGYALLNAFGLAGALRPGLTGKYWRHLFGSDEVLRSLAYSAYIAASALAWSTSLALGLTWWLRRRNGGLFSLVLYLPLSIPAIVAAFVSFQALSKSGLGSRLAFALGWITDLRQFPDWVNDPGGIGIIATHTLLALPFFTIYFLHSYATEHLAQLEQVAQSLGAGARQSAWRVTVPVLLHRAFPTLVMYFIFLLGSYEVPLLLGVQAPQMLSVLTVRKLRDFDLNAQPEAYALATLYAGLVFTLVYFLFRKRRLVDGY